MVNGGDRYWAGPDIMAMPGNIDAASIELPCGELGIFRIL